MLKKIVKNFFYLSQDLNQTRSVLHHFDEVFRTTGLHKGWVLNEFSLYVWFKVSSSRKKLSPKLRSETKSNFGKPLLYSRYIYVELISENIHSLHNSDLTVDLLLY